MTGAARGGATGPEGATAGSGGPELREAGAPVLAVPEAELVDLRQRLRRTRWAAPWPERPGAEARERWRAGADPAELRRLVAQWADGFDWRAAEASINALPWHSADVDGAPVRFLRFDAETPGALPLVLTHGWPSTVLELVPLAQRLSRPSADGEGARRAFTVIVPALPGFPFTPARRALATAATGGETHELWHQLMTEHLGFSRYGAHGGDLGAGVSSRLGQAHPEAVVGIHLLAVADPPVVDEATVTPAEQAFRERAATWFAEEGAYEHQQMTRPLTLAQPLADSPSGLLAWLVEKWRAWSDDRGLPAPRFSDQDVLTWASLYWFSGAISTSFQPYYAHARGTTTPVVRVDVPTAVALFPRDLARPPRSWVERTYRVTRYTSMPRGGHFAAYEEPDLLAADLEAFFRDLR